MSSVVSKLSIVSGLDRSGQIENFNLIEIECGQSVAIVGATGSGKSQLLYDIERLAQGDTKSKRMMLINDESPACEIRFDPKRKLVASLSQSMHFLTDMVVNDFLILHLESRGKELNQKVIELVIENANEITGEPISGDMNLLSLSGGQSRALMIADVAIISDSPIVLIDELENAGIKKDRAIEILEKSNKIVFIATHDPALALSADKRLILKNGGIERVLTTTSREHAISDYLNVLENCNSEIREKVRSGEEIVNIGIDYKCLYE